MASRWKWFLGGGVGGFVLGVVAVGLVTARIEWERSPGPWAEEASLTWVEHEEEGAIIREQQDRYGVRAGDLRSRYANGRPAMEMRFRDGQEDGAVVAWGPEGQWALCGGYSGGHFHGTWIFWGEQASAFLELPLACAVVTYDHGRQEGPTTAWREDGSLDPEVTGWYEHDERVRDLEPHEVHRRPGC